MKSKLSIFTFILLFCTSISISQVNFQKVIDKSLEILSGLDKNDSINQNNSIKNNRTDIVLNKEDFSNYQKYLLLLKNEDELEQKFGGKISFGLNGLEVDNNSLFIIQTGVELLMGTFPFQFKFHSGVQAQTQNGTLNETVSDIGISFDYNIWEDINKETYVFVDRTSNSFLGIDQRYEIGGGFIFSHYSGKKTKVKKHTQGVLKKGNIQIEKLSFEKSSNQIIDSTSFKNITNTIKERINDDYKEELDGLISKKENLIKRNQKKYSKTRLSILLGLNYELEKTEDNLRIFHKDTSIIDSFPATNRFRLVARPGFEWLGSNFSFDTKAYFKIGFFGETENTITKSTVSDKRIDYWVEWKSTLSFQFSEKISLGISYIYFYDNAPNRSFVNQPENGEDNFKLFSAEDTFKAITFKFGYKL